jgi:two-component sensor histidine kinase
VLLLRDTTDIRRRERALLSKDATIREIHHRVKNNLQTVAALLRLQSRRSSDEAISAALGDAQVRVAAIAVVHEALSSDSSNEADLGESVEFDRIVRALFSIVVEDPQSPLTLELSGEAGRLSAERATPLAMCVSELVHNAVQHAQGTFVTVEAVRAPDSLTIAVVDDGVGVDPDQLEAAGLGLNIVRSLATTELGGTFEFADQEYGTRAVVHVPLSGG